MAKSDKKGDKKAKAPLSKVIKTVSPAKAKEAVVKIATKKSKDKATTKPVKKPVSESDSSDSDSEEEAKPSVSNGKGKEVSSDESSESSSEDEKPKAALVKPSAKAAASESESDSSDSDEEPAPKKTVALKAAAVAPATKKTAHIKKKPASSASGSGDSDSDSDDEPTTQSAPTPKKTAPTPTKKAPAKKEASSSSDESSEESDDEDKPAVAAAKKPESSSDESSDEESDSDVEMKDATAAKSGKRKAEDDTPAPPKKVKLANGDAAPVSDAAEESKSIFVGRLSWSVDNDRLAQEFAECGEVVSATVQMDRSTGKSRGFGYVHFATAEAVDKALAMNGREIDGRPVNIDRSQQLDKGQTREKRAQAFGDQTSPPSATLFVGNLSFGVTEDTVWGFFNEWGVKSVRLPTDRESGRPKGFGYVEFEDVEGAKKAFEACNGADVEGRNIRLDYSQPRDNSGGGRGGDRGGFGGRGRGGDRGGFRGRGGDRGFGGRGRGGDRGRGRGAPRGGARSGGIAAFEGKKITF